MKPRIGGRSPWGVIESVYDVDLENAGRLVGVSTPSHGGVWVHPDLRSTWLIIPCFACINGDQCWLEEDCEWALAAFVFEPIYDTGGGYPRGSAEWHECSKRNRETRDLVLKNVYPHLMADLRIRRNRFKIWHEQNTKRVDLDGHPAWDWAERNMTPEVQG